VLETFLLALEEREASGMVITVTVTMMSSQRPTVERRIEQPGLQPLSQSFPRLDPDDSSPHEIAEALKVAFCRCQEGS
jgi:aerobic-type carbon monoxide dehydrogenase small subunit (CoxS/CutS family)